MDEMGLDLLRRGKWGGLGGEGGDGVCLFVLIDAG